jgi:hypothetical protein
MTSEKLNKLLFAFLGLIGIILISIIVATLGTGFDLSDEGFYFLHIEYADLYGGGVSNYHIIIDKLSSWMNPNILDYRIMGVILTLLSPIMLCFGMYKWLERQYPGMFAKSTAKLVMAFVFLGGYSYFILSINAINYNTLTNFLVLNIVGLMAYLLSMERSFFLSTKLNISAIVGIGFLTALLFFVKFSASALLIVGVVLMLIFHLQKQKIRVYVQLLLFIAIGFGLGLLLYFSVFQSFADWKYSFQSEYAMAASLDHSPLLLLKGYRFAIFKMVKFSALYFSWLILVPIFIYSALRKNKLGLALNKPGLGKLLLLFGLLLFVLECIYFNLIRSVNYTGQWRSSYIYFYLIALQIGLLIAIIASGENSIKKYLKKHFQSLLLVVFLIATPFVASFGTANNILLNAFFYGATIFPAILILTFHLSQFTKSKWLIVSFMLLPAMALSSQIIDTYFNNPYYSWASENKSNYFDQTESVDALPKLRGVRVDQETKRMLTALKSVLLQNDFKKGDAILGIHIPGVVYLMDGVSPVIPWYMNLDRDVLAFEKYDPKQALPVIIFSEKSYLSEDLINLMDEKEIHFPLDYQKPIKLDFPYDGKGSKLSVYFPEN